MSDHLSESLVGLLVDRAGKSPHRLAAIANERGRWVTISVAQLVERTIALALGLSEAGLVTGDRVAILFGNDPEWLVVDLAAQAIGAVSVAVPHHDDDDELAATLRALGVAAVVVVDEVDADRLSGFVEVNNLESIKHIIHLGASEDGAGGLDNLIARGASIIEERPAAFSELVESISAEAPATITFTSGSGGSSSPVVHTGGALLAHARQVAQSFGMVHDDVAVVSMDPSHPFERAVTIYPALVSGAVLAFPEAPSSEDRAIMEVRPTFAHLPIERVRLAASTVHGRFYRNRGFKRLVARWWTRSALKATRSGQRPSRLVTRLVGRPILRSLGWENLRYLLVTGETVPVDVLVTLQALGLPVRSGYVVVEAGLVAVGDPRDGWGLPPTDGVTVTQSGGQLVVSSKGMGAGYADGTALPLHADGGLLTGDLGQVSEGKVHVRGPVSSQIDLRDGRHLLAAEIERSLRDSPYIALAAVRFDVGVLRVDIEIDRDTVSDWAASRSLQFTTFSSLVELNEVKSLIADEVAGLAVDIEHHDLLSSPFQQGRDITRTGRTIFSGLNYHDAKPTSTKQ